MSSRGSITLSDLQGKLTMLEVTCHRRKRRGRVSHSSPPRERIDVV